MTTHNLELKFELHTTFTITYKHVDVQNQEKMDVQRVHNQHDNFLKRNKYTLI